MGEGAVGGDGTRTRSGAVELEAKGFTRTAIGARARSGVAASSASATVLRDRRAGNAEIRKNRQAAQTYLRHNLE
jgi:hypothetical protein